MGLVSHQKFTFVFCAEPQRYTITEQKTGMKIRDFIPQPSVKDVMTLNLNFNVPHILGDVIPVNNIVVPVPKMKKMSAELPDEAARNSSKLTSPEFNFTSL